MIYIYVYCLIGWIFAMFLDLYIISCDDKHLSDLRVFSVYKYTAIIICSILWIITLPKILINSVKYKGV